MKQVGSFWFSNYTREELESYTHQLECDLATSDTRLESRMDNLFKENYSLRNEIFELKENIRVLTAQINESDLFIEGIKTLLSNKNYNKLRVLFELDPPPPPFSGCRYSCTDCIKDGLTPHEICNFCNDDCANCRSITDAKLKIGKQSLEKQIRKEINRDNRESANQDTITTMLDNSPQILNSTPGLIQNDRYLFITLTVSPTWGSREYLTSQLIKNFNKMSPPSYCPIATAYVVADNESGIVHLHGLVRFDWENIDKKKCKISESTAIFKNTIQREGTKGKANQELGRTTLTTISNYSNRKYTTSPSSIIEKWEYMRNQHGQIYEPTGDNLDKFL
jgi:hypothetical protein